MPALQPREHALRVGCVGDDAEALFAEPVHDCVVDDAALLVAEQAVARPPHGHRLADVAGVRPVEERAGVRAFNGEAAHVRYVECAGGGPHRAGLRDDAGVLHGHVVTREGDHAPAEGDVLGVQHGCAEVSVSGHTLRLPQDAEGCEGNQVTIGAFDRYGASLDGEH